MAAKLVVAPGSTAAVVEKFDRLRVWGRRGERAPHKPLLVLWALGQWQARRETQFPFSAVEEALGSLLREFGPPRRPEPKFPFIHLANDDVWVVTPPASRDGRDPLGSRSVKLLRETGVLGGFTRDVLSALESDSGLLGRIASRLLDAHFPRSFHQDLLDATGLQLVASDTGPEPSPAEWRRRRDPGFRERILRTYERRCAVCGLDVKIAGVSALLEASHIRWFEADGPDEESNGIALCPLHHKMFDFGCFTLGNDLRIEVSDDVTGGDVFVEVLARYHETALRRPIHEAHLPKRAHVEWHRREVFKGRPR